MKKKIKFKSNNHGSALIVVVLAFFVIAIISMGVMSVAMVNNNASRYDQKYQSSYYISEAGINYKIKDIQSGIDTILTTSADAPAFFASIESSYMNDSIYSDFSNTYGSAPQAQVSMELAQVISETEREYRIISEGDIDGKSRNTVSTIKISWQAATETAASPIAFIYGNSFSFSGNNVEGDGASVIVNGSLNSSNFNGGSFNGISNIYIDGNLEIGAGITIGSSTQPGDIFINGDLTLSGGADFYGDLYVAGNLVSTGGPEVHVGKVYVQGSGYLKNGTYNDDVYIEGDVYLKDAMIVKNIYANSDVELDWTPGGNFKMYYYGSLVKPATMTLPPRRTTQEYIKASAKAPIPGFTIPGYDVELREDLWYSSHNYVSESIVGANYIVSGEKIIADGDITINLNRWQEPNVSDVVVISKHGNITVNGYGDMSGTLVAPEGKVAFSSSGDFTGVIHTKDGYVQSNGGSKLTAENWTDLFSEENLPLTFLQPDIPGGGTGDPEEDRIAFFIDPIREN
jgi:hypothetical protein